MTLRVDPVRDSALIAPAPVGRATWRVVAARRLVALLLIAVPLAWSWQRAVPGGSEVLNRGGLALIGDLLASAVHPQLSPDYLVVVANDTVVTLTFAVLGAVGALVVGLVGGLVLSDAAWDRRPPRPVLALRLLLRGLLVAARSVHELVWALLFVSVLGLDPLVAVLAIIVPFGAQTAKVYAEIMDAVPRAPRLALRNAGAGPVAVLCYALLPAASPLLVSYAFYRFECAVRSAVVLGVVGVGGLGQELVVTLESRNWTEVWTLVWTVLLLSAVVDLWSTRLRQELAVVSCSDWSGGRGAAQRRPGRSRWVRWSAVVASAALVAALFASDLSLANLVSPRTGELTVRLLRDMWPPSMPRGGFPVLGNAVLDTVAMAILATGFAVFLTLLIGPWAVQRRPSAEENAGIARRLVRGWLWWVARAILLALRSVPPTVWAVVALLALFPGILPGALALGLYTGGILGRLVAEAWESIGTRPRDSLRANGSPTWLASLAAVVPPSAHHLLAYTFYRFEICVRETAVVGVVGAAGLGRLLADDLAAFWWPAVTTLLAASFALSIGAELLGRRLRHALRP